MYLICFSLSCLDIHVVVIQCTPFYEDTIYESSEGLSSTTIPKPRESHSVPAQALPTHEVTKAHICTVAYMEWAYGI